MTPGVSTRQRLLLAAVCAVAVSTIYAIQPVIELAGADLGVSAGALGWLVAAGQLGYLVGLLVLVPLGDLLDRRRLIVIHLLAAALAVGLTALAPNGVLAAVGLIAAGLSAVVVQITVAYVAAVSPPEVRGRNIGSVTAGVVVGILGARVIAGVLGDTLGWRSVYGVLAALCLVLAVLAPAVLQPDARSDRPRYRDVLARTRRLATTDRLFLSRGLIALFLFASFGTLWSGLALPLGAAPWDLGSTVIGLFGVIGLVGALGAARAGRWADRGHAQRVTGGSLALLAASWLLIAHTTPTLWWLIAGIVVLDFAVQAVHVSNQHLLTTAYPDTASSVIGGYMAFYSVGSALGALTASGSYATWGWGATSICGAAFAVAGIVVWAVHRFSSRRRHRGRAEQQDAAPGVSR